ncbi:MAG: CHAD domain protein [Chloroflexi bacterium ADurb.Bin325]|nr:MAG: CHAD domain protein [Chloroflexi bacterium ADurb.Bin325]
MEIEAKFAIPNRQVYRDLLRVRQLAGFTLVPAGTANVTDHYVDTADARLLHAGYACRLRAEGAQVLVSLKSLGGAEGAVHYRDEQEVWLPALTLDIHAWPAGPARDLALRLAGGAALQALLDLEQRRARADLVEPLPGRARRVAQFSLDAVRAAGGRRPTSYYELEIELIDDGTEADLARIAAELAETYRLTPETRSKFERGLALRRPAAAAQPLAVAAAEPLLPDEPMSEAGRKLLRLHFGRMLANEAGTRVGEDIEALHDMRVATRRMRAAYGVFAEYYDRATLDPFNKGLRRTGRSLGAVRDLDVLLEKAEAYRAALPPEATADIDPLLEEWRARREKARGRMLAYLDGQSYRTFVADFRTFLATPDAGALAYAAEQPVPYQVRHVVPRLIFTRYEAVRAYEPVIAAAPLPTYHLLRIDCKRLRYALEFFRDVLGPEAAGLIKQVTALQDLLGALQDAHVAEGLIAEFLQKRSRRRKKAPAVPLAGVERYLAAQRATQEDLLVLFPPAWAEIVGPDFRRALALAVSVL